LSNITIDDIIKNWTQKLKIILLTFYIFAGIVVTISMMSNFILTNIFLNIIFLIAIVFCGLFTFIVHQKSQILLQSWYDEFTHPTQKLLKTIQMVAMQKLDLLPEEQLNSFTSESHLKLLEVARGILEHQRFIDQVVDNMFEMMFLLNQDGIIMKANKSACETTHFTQTELIGQHIRKLFPHAESLVDYYLELEIQFTTQGFVRDVEVFVQTSEGELLPFSINGVKIESTTGILLGYTMIAKNQAETVRLFNQLNKSNYELGRANDELGKRYDQIKKEIEEKEGQRRTLEMELATSQIVQKTFLPQTNPEHPFIECAGTAIPAAFCGGDWWNTITLKDKFYVFIADVTGHGTASAMVTAAVSGYFVSIKTKLFSGENLDVDDILAGFDTVLSSMGQNDVGYNMTCFSCVFDFEKKVIRFSNAGHNFPIIIKENKKVETLIASGHRLGNSGSSTIEKKQFEKKELPMKGGEFVFFYTDGLIENKNDKDDEYGKLRLRKFIEKNYTKPSSEFVSLLLQDGLEFYGPGKPLEDDITVIVTKVKPL
jgi:sigma-B regulation protein RsbU (phosphoserine phosphatase)